MMALAPWVSQSSESSCSRTQTVKGGRRVYEEIHVGMTQKLYNAVEISASCSPSQATEKDGEQRNSKDTNNTLVFVYRRHARTPTTREHSTAALLVWDNGHQKSPAWLNNGVCYLVATYAGVRCHQERIPTNWHLIGPDLSLVEWIVLF